MKTHYPAGAIVALGDILPIHLCKLNKYFNKNIFIKKPKTFQFFDFLEHVEKGGARYESQIGATEPN